ncbi:hypothetical protein KR018_005712, partial [Drosophila ironensis]
KQDKQKRPATGKQKYNQKFCEKWLKIFEPWLRRDPSDPDKPFCRACQCSMDCNRCHLVRHEHTTKHKRNLEFLVSQGEGATRREVRVRQERSKYYRQRKTPKQLQQPNAKLELSDPLSEDAPSRLDAAPVELEERVPVLKQELQLETAPVAPASSNTPKRSASAASNQEGHKLLLQIHQDKTELMESFRELMGSQAPQALLQPPARDRNHVDLFFESVSSSVKALSPRLIAEAKMRVSQVICELELRGLKEPNTPSEDAAPPPPPSSLFLLRPA